MNLNYYATLYSKEQDAFHIELLSETFSKNIKMCIMKNGNDYLITGIHETQKEAIEFNKLLSAKQKTLKKTKKEVQNG